MSNSSIIPEDKDNSITQWAHAAFICGKMGGSFESFLCATYQPKSGLSWRKIDPYNPPTGPVLMKNSAEGVLSGIIQEWNGEFMGYENYPEDSIEGKDNWQLRGATHYILQSDLLNLPK